jgi:hypothetical protein
MGVHPRRIDDLANALLTTTLENMGTILDSSKSQCVVWAAQLARGGLAWTRKSS